MSDQTPESRAMGAANMLRFHLLPWLVLLEPVEVRGRLLELYDAMLRELLKAHYERRGGGGAA